MGAAGRTRVAVALRGPVVRDWLDERRSGHQTGFDHDALGPLVFADPAAAEAEWRIVGVAGKDRDSCGAVLTWALERFGEVVPDGAALLADRTAAIRVEVDR